MRKENEKGPKGKERYLRVVDDCLDHKRWRKRIYGRLRGLWMAVLIGKSSRRVLMEG